MLHLLLNPSFRPMPSVVQWQEEASGKKKLFKLELNGNKNGVVFGKQLNLALVTPKKEKNSTEVQHALPATKQYTSDQTNKKRKSTCEEAVGRHQSFTDTVGCDSPANEDILVKFTKPANLRMSVEDWQCVVRASIDSPDALAALA